MEVYSGLHISVCRTVRETQTYTVSIPFETTYCYDNSVPKGTEVVITPGEPGQMLCTANVVYVDGVETGRTVIEETVTQQPVNRLVAVGSMLEPLSLDDPVDELRIEGGYIYLPNGEVYSYTGSMQVTATAYSHLDPGCDFITATGTTVHIGTVAVDPRLIPLGTRMFIVTNDGCYVYGVSTAEDTGSSIKEAKIDLYFPTYEQCIQFGRRTATVYFLG
jgi:3D (Asp-Asp-Asp) domain-containing protein